MLRKSLCLAEVKIADVFVMQWKGKKISNAPEKLCIMPGAESC